MFWNKEGNASVRQLTAAMLDYGVDNKLFTGKDDLLALCRRTVTRLQQDSPIADLEALTAISDERDFEAIAKAVAAAIEKNEPEAGLDRLHTFVIKYVRTVCTHHGLTVTRDKPLHSLFGEYVKWLRDGGHIESVMGERILKSSISTLEAFNDVRNNRSLAHDNTILPYEESLLIFNHVASTIRFLGSVEQRLQEKEEASVPEIREEDVPF